MFVATKGCSEHEECGLRHVEVGEHSVSYREIVGREDKLARPAFKFFDATFCAHTSFKGTLHGSSYGANLMSLLFCGIDHLTALFAHEHLLAVHLVFGEIFHIGLCEVAQTTVEGDECRFDALDLHALHHVLAEVQTCSGSGDRAFVFGEDALETFQIFWFRRTLDDFMRNGSFAKCIKLLAELIVITIVEESQGATAACGVVDNFSHDGVVFSKVELVANTDFTRWIYEYIPKTKIAVEFA